MVQWTEILGQRPTFNDKIRAYDGRRLKFEDVIHGGIRVVVSSLSQEEKDKLAMEFKAKLEAAGLSVMKVDTGYVCYIILNVKIN